MSRVTRSYSEIRMAFLRILRTALNSGGGGDMMRASIPLDPSDDDQIVGDALEELRDLRANGEAETVARIVAWLRSEASKPERYRDAEAWELIADAIERGDWRNGGDTRD